MSLPALLDCLLRVGAKVETGRKANCMHLRADGFHATVPLSHCALCNGTGRVAETADRYVLVLGARAVGARAAEKVLLERFNQHITRRPEGRRSATHFGSWALRQPEVQALETVEEWLKCEEQDCGRTRALYEELQGCLRRRSLWAKGALGEACCFNHVVLGDHAKEAINSGVQEIGCTETGRQLVSKAVCAWALEKP